MAVTPPPVVQVQPMQIQHHLDLASIQCTVSGWFSDLGHMFWAALAGVVLGVLMTLWYKKAGSLKAMVQTIQKDVADVKSKVSDVKAEVTPAPVA